MVCESTVRVLVSYVGEMMNNLRRHSPCRVMKVGSIPEEEMYKIYGHQLNFSDVSIGRGLVRKSSLAYDVDY